MTDTKKKDCIGQHGWIVQPTEAENTISSSPSCVANLQEFVNISKKMMDYCQKDSKCKITIQDDAVYAVRTDNYNTKHYSYVFLQKK